MPDINDTVVFNGSVFDIEDNRNKVNSINDEAINNVNYPTVKAVNDFVNTKETALNEKINNINEKIEYSPNNKFIGETITPLYIGSTNNLIHMTDGNDYAPAENDVVYAPFDFDFNNDGKEDTTDWTLLRLEIATGLYNPRYDTNCDGVLDVKDNENGQKFFAGSGIITYNYLIFKNDVWERYVIAADKEYNPQSLNAQSGVAVANAIAGIGGNIDLSNYYTKGQIDNMIGDIDTALDELHNYAQALIGGNG